MLLVPCKTVKAAPISIGSPKGVPVPCISNTAISCNLASSHHSWLCCSVLHIHHTKFDTSTCGGPLQR